jgi:hypothetical protein
MTLSGALSFIEIVLAENTPVPAGFLARLLQASDGNFYGTTLNGAFRMSPGGLVTRFDATVVFTAEVRPRGPVIQAAGSYYIAGGLIPTDANPLAFVTRSGPILALRAAQLHRNAVVSVRHGTVTASSGRQRRLPGRPQAAEVSTAHRVQIAAIDPLPRRCRSSRRRVFVSERHAGRSFKPPTASSMGNYKPDASFPLYGVQHDHRRHGRRAACLHDGPGGPTIVRARDGICMARPCAANSVSPRSA